MLLHRWATDEVPGISIMFGECYSSQDWATAIGVAPSRLATDSSTAAARAAEQEVWHVRDVLLGLDRDSIVDNITLYWLAGTGTRPTWCEPRGAAVRGRSGPRRSGRRRRAWRRCYGCGC